MVVMWHAKYSLSHAHPVATTEALNESCKLSMELDSVDQKKRLSTSKTIVRGNLGYVTFYRKVGLRRNRLMGCIH